MKTIYTFLLLCIAFSLQAQSIDTSVISNSGGTNSNTSHILTFTIGETFIGEISDSESIAQGFWSGIASQSVLSTDEFLQDNTVISVYPNPVSDFFVIKIPNSNRYDMSLFNSKGQKVLTQKINTTISGDRIDISSLSQGIYILSLSIPETKENKTVKIIKQ